MESPTDRHRHLTAALLAIIGDGEMSLNKAGLALLKNRGDLFPTYADKNFGGKCPTTVRRVIEEAVSAKLPIAGAMLTIEERTGFGVGGSGKAKYLVRQTHEIAPPNTQVMLISVFTETPG